MQYAEFAQCWRLHPSGRESLDATCKCVEYNETTTCVQHTDAPRSTVLRGEERWVVPPAVSQCLLSNKLHQLSNVEISDRYQRNLALFNKTVAARSWTSAAVQGFHW